MFTARDLAKLELMALWSRNRLGPQIHCQVLSEGLFKPSNAEDFPKKSCGVIIGINPGGLKVGNPAGRAELANSDGSRQWHLSIQTPTHKQIFLKLPQLHGRLPNMEPVGHVVIINPITVVHPIISAALKAIEKVSISKQVDYAKKQMEYLDTIGDVRWVWCAWSTKLNSRVAGAIYEWICAWTAKTQKPVFYVEDTQPLPWVCHINYGLRKKDQPIGKVCILPQQGAPRASNRIRGTSKKKRARWRRRP